MHNAGTGGRCLSNEMSMSRSRWEMCNSLHAKVILASFPIICLWSLGLELVQVSLPVLLRCVNIKFVKTTVIHIEKKNKNKHRIWDWFHWLNAYFIQEMEESRNPSLSNHYCQWIQMGKVRALWVLDNDSKNITKKPIDCICEIIRKCPLITNSLDW